MRNYPDWTTSWRTADGRCISISRLETDHLANVIDFVRWDAAKELGFVLKGPWAFDLSRLSEEQVRRLNHLIKAKVPCAPNLELEARKRGIWNPFKNAKDVLKSQVAVDIETAGLNPWPLWKEPEVGRTSSMHSNLGERLRPDSFVTARERAEKIAAAARTPNLELKSVKVELYEQGQVLDKLKEEQTEQVKVIDRLIERLEKQTEIAASLNRQVLKLFSEKEGLWRAVNQLHGRFIENELELKPPPKAPAKRKSVKRRPVKK